ncbi:VTT domain-containing protein [Desulfonatronum thioautotrophicum]|uniref:VTT domain-containing protein n=1 Tax=Desulfonatronum thioautotrophicum TaxID=617001 RepID=UPI0005EBC95D|nr:VTT domain-containing protein [Desulfonatronum thioautotrophicum]
MTNVPNKLFIQGKNCWAIASAKRAAVLRNGEAYFAAFHHALLQARKQVFILGWDIHSKEELLRGEAAVEAKARNLPTRLGPLLDHVVRSKPDLDIRILIWNFSMLLSLEREPNLFFNLGWAPHPRIHLHMDDEHPVGASHHQKIVVVDGELAFCGGLDLTHYRWDTEDHEPDDPRRRTPAGRSYGPYHDVMMMVEGEVAAKLGELCAYRWHKATAEVVEQRIDDTTDAWPEWVQPWFRHINVGIVRTLPEYKSQQEVREVEALYLDAIRSARRSIFIENQYFTAPILCTALEQRLQETDGPEVVIILPKKISGWLGNKVMEAKRVRILDRLMQADVHNRLRLRHPWVGEQTKHGVMVHAKLMVVDDRLMRVGSANLCNRSMGLDTECDLAIEAQNPEQEAGVRRLRNELLAEHFGVTVQEVDAQFQRPESKGSLTWVIDQLSDPEQWSQRLKGLGPLEIQEEEFPELVSEAEILDPEKPLEVDRLMDAFVPARESSQDGWLRANWLWLILGACALVGLAAAWRFTGLAEIADRQRLAEFLQIVPWDVGLYPLLLIGFVVGGLSMFPVTVLIGATAILLDPLPALVTAFAGTQLSALVTYGVGWRLGRERIQRMAGSRLNRISRQLARHGVVSIAVIRNLPIAPFTIVNLVAGASHIRLRDYLVGTLLGMAPGILAVTIFTDQLLGFLQEPNPLNILFMAGALIFLVVASRWLKRRFS